MQLRKLFHIAVIVGLVCLYSATAEARHKQSANRMAGKTTTVTGCLQKGDEANEYKLVGQGGKTYGLYRSGSVKFAEHVGHKVSVTGNFTHEKKESSTQEKAERKSGMPEESAHLKVSSMQHISDTCTH